MVRRALMVLLVAELAMAADPLPLWQEAAAPQRYLEASGRRSAAFGNTTGFELWLFPLKAVHDLRLLFQSEGSLEPAAAAPLAARVEVTPAATTVIYSHAAFTVKQTLWAPLDRAALVMEIEVDASRPLTVLTEFRSDLKPMWPASLGGVYNAWQRDVPGMLLAEPTHRATALIGSPAFEAWSDEGDHMLPDRPTLLRLKPFSAGPSRATVVIAGGLGDAAATRKLWRDVYENAPRLRSELDAHWARFLERTTQLVTPDETVNRAWLWGRIALEKGFACNAAPAGAPECGLIAGYGPSGSSERPGFGWYFGGDALMNVAALLDYGDFEGARTALEFLRARQRADGKMMHEMTMSAQLMEQQGSGWFQLPYAYYHADTTPLYLAAARAYFVRSGDVAWLREAWPSLRKAYEYCGTTVDDDGLMSNLKAGMAAVETGALRGKVRKDIYLQGFWLAALDAMVQMAAAAGEPAIAGQARQQLQRARASLNGWFSEQKKLFPFGVLTDNTRLDALTAWPAVALAFGGLDDAKSRAGVDALTRPELMTGWGARWVATNSGIYNPVGYNDGSVWPFMTGYAIQALYRYHRAEPAWQQLAAMAALTGFSGPGYVPENFSGDRRQTLPRAVPHQLFSTGAGVMQSLMSGMLGLSSDATTRTIRLAPHLPAGWEEVSIRNYRMGAERFDFELRRGWDGYTLKARSNAAAPYHLEFSPSLPFASAVKGGTATDRDLHVTLSAEVAPAAELAIDFQPGIEVFPDIPEAVPGGRETGLRITGGECQGDMCAYTLAGEAGRDYTVRFSVGGKEQTRVVRMPASGTTILLLK